MAIRKIIFGLLLIGIVSACGGSGGGNRAATGTLSVGLTDASVDLVSQVRLFVTGITVKPAGGPPEFHAVSLDPCGGVPGETDDCNPVDLLALQDGIVLTVIDNLTLPAGRYQWIRLEVDNENSYVVENDGGIETAFDVRVPSARGLQLSSGFTILAGQRTDLVMDWDARQGLADPTGQDGYILKPSIRVVDMAQFGTLTGTIDQCTDTAVVYVFEDDLIPDPPADPTANLDDIDNNEPNPLVTASATQRGDGSFGYEINYLAVGTYTVALTCDIDDVPASDVDLTDADDPITFVSPQVVNIANGATATIDF